MNFDEEDLKEMMSMGRKVNGWSPAPEKEGDDPEVKLLQRILKALEHMATKPDPEMPKIPEPKPPVVNVAPPAVTVNPAKPITKWKFTLTKDKAGNTTEIIAEAL
jgi:hypothetical protein